MAISKLSTSYQDDVLSSDMSGTRRYNMVSNSDGTVSFTDATTYSQTGSDFGAGDVNATNEAVNEIIDTGVFSDDIRSIVKVTALPSSPDANTLYVIVD